MHIEELVVVVRPRTLAQYRCLCPARLLRIKRCLLLCAQWAFAITGIRDPALFDALAENVRQHCSDYNAQVRSHAAHSMLTHC